MLPRLAPCHTNYRSLNNIVAVKAIDDGIEIHSLAFCFQYMENCKSFDLAKFDM